MRANVFHGPNNIRVEEVPRPNAGVGEAVIRITLTTICGTDLHIYEWDDWAKSTIPVPMVIGHEFVGEIAAVGSNVKTTPVNARSSSPISIRRRPMAGSLMKTLPRWILSRTTK